VRRPPGRSTFCWIACWICWIWVWTLLFESCVSTLVITLEPARSLLNSASIPWMNGVLTLPGEK